MPPSTRPPSISRLKRQRPLLQRLVAAGQANARAAEEELASALKVAGIVLPSLAADCRSGCLSGVFLVDLGGARPDVVMRLAAVVRRGAAAESAEQRAAPG
ncbi:hypothetical protein [Kitasatospora sp. GP82]|uniref:hypothetical protein n=1 Tax=Kitasatospora sp. GP82 TaxID=3035089 RepID=UPI002475CA6F|nr:hypothetical protein [Kitasatospora sp. GP82]MDH6123612.1 hypothetical protein [Kitasatospora sp. GP82]